VGLKKLAVLGAAVILALLAGGLPLVMPAGAGFDYNVDVYVDGKLVEFPDQKPFIDESAGRTYVPVRFVSEALGYLVEWDGSAQTASIGRGGVWVEIAIGSDRAVITEVDTGKITGAAVDAPALLLNGRTMVPLRFISEALKAGVTWTPPGDNGGRGKAEVRQEQAVIYPGKPAGKVETGTDGGSGGVNTTPPRDTKWPETK
jgi:hypothetical protein